MTVYLDVILVENILINYIILLSTAIISKAKINSAKILLSSLAGGIYAILNYLVNLNAISNIIIKIIMSVIMIIVAFESNKVKNIIRQVIFFYLVSFTFGGVAFMLLFFINPERVIMRNNVLVGTYPLKVAILGGIVGFTIISVVAKIIKDRMSKKSMLCDLEIFYKGKYTRVKTMIDTGNLLKEPISQTDVIVVEKESLINIIDIDILNNIKNIIQGKWLEEDNNEIHSYKFKIIPFSSLGNNNGLLIGFKPDYVKIYDETENVKNNVVIGIYDGKLSKSNLYTSLIGLDILKEGDRKNEFAKNA